MHIKEANMERLHSACFLPYDILESIKTVQMIKKVTGRHGLGEVSEVKVVQSCLTLCDPMDHTVRGILQARILEWLAFPFSKGSSQPRDETQVSCTAGGFFAS